MSIHLSLDLKRFIDEQFGGVVPLCEAHPEWPSAQVHKWRQRNSLPGLDLAMLLAIIEKRDGRPVSILNYLQGDTCSAVSKPKLSTTGPTFDVFE